MVLKYFVFVSALFLFSVSQLKKTGTQFVSSSSTKPSATALTAQLKMFESKITFPVHLQKTTIAKLKEKDSLCYYQCYCALGGNPPTFLPKDSVKTKALKKGLLTVTEKFSLTKNGDQYRMRYYSSALYDYPNKKYAYLKLSEKAYWNFILVKDTLLSEISVQKLAALELKLRPLTEYNFRVEADNYPQLIMNGKKISEQRMVEGDYLIRRELSEFK